MHAMFANKEIALIDYPVNIPETVTLNLQFKSILKSKYILNSIHYVNII